MDSQTLSLIKKAYIALLMSPHDSTRMANQNILCELRDCIANETGLKDQDVQEEYEYKAMKLQVVGGKITTEYANKGY